MKIATIIPAYNEEKNILRVIEVVKDIAIIDEIIVISDGSLDRTAEVVPNLPKVRVVKLLKNKGKGAALIEGAKMAKADILLLLDADLVGLNKQHIQDLLNPVIWNEVDMTKGIFINGRRSTDWSHKIAPNISGQRAVRRDILLNIVDLDQTRFGAEVAINRYVKKNKLRAKKVKLSNITHITKEEKLGIARGMKSRVKMYWDIAKYITKPKKKTKKWQTFTR